MLKLSTDFETGSGTLHQLAPAHWRLETVADLFGYNRYFCVRLKNSGVEQQVFHLEIHPDPALGADSHFMTHFPSHIWCGEMNWSRWRPLRNTWEDAVRFHADHLEVHFPVEPGQAFFLASNVPQKYSALCDWIAQLPETVTVESLGQSFEERDIPILRLGKNGQPRVLVLAGMHSSEHSGIFAAQGIVEYLSSRIAEARQIAEAFDIAVIPMLNPDGNVHGFSGGTAQRLTTNNSMDFESAANGVLPQTHENQLLWQWISEQFKPDISLHFHGYLGWKRNGEHPYDGIYLLDQPAQLLSTPRLEQHQAIADRLLFETPAYSAHWRTVGTLTSVMLEYQMAKRFETVSVLYEVNGGSVGASEQFRRGPQVLGAMCRALLDDV